MRKAGLTVIAYLLLLCADTAQAKITATQTCERSKLKAQGALEVCLKQNSANILLSQPDASATCWSNFNAALAKADATAAKAGASCRYVDNGDGTVSDLNTGLMWEQTTGTIGGTPTGNVNDVNNTYTWSTGDNLADGTAFTSFLARLNNGAAPAGGSLPPGPITGCFANHCDWRLPSILELQGIVSNAPGCGRVSACIDPVFGPTQETQDLYWSATSFNGNIVWVVFFANGGVVYTIKPIKYYVRAVRGGL
jgi:Protein of unknown function (DUF1566)